MISGALIFINSFVLMFAIKFFIATIQELGEVLYLNNTDEITLTLLLLIATICLGAITINTIISNVKKIWIKRR